MGKDGRHKGFEWPRLPLTRELKTTSNEHPHHHHLYKYYVTGTVSRARSPNSPDIGPYCSNVV
jgi:hypothetical protein